MHENKNMSVIALSIRPIYADAILSGKKIVEFRKTAVPCDANVVVLYATAPVKKIVGYFEVYACDEDAPYALWDRYGYFGLISRLEFDAYYEGHERGRCFLIKKAYRFYRPVPLAECESFGGVPRLFAYVTKSEWEKLEKRNAYEIAIDDEKKMMRTAIEKSIERYHLLPGEDNKLLFDTCRLLNVPPSQRSLGDHNICCCVNRYLGARNPRAEKCTYCYIRHAMRDGIINFFDDKTRKLCAPTMVDSDRPFLVEQLKKVAAWMGEKCLII